MWDVPLFDAASVPCSIWPPFHASFHVPFMPAFMFARFACSIWPPFHAFFMPATCALQVGSGTVRIEIDGYPRLVDDASLGRNAPGA